MINLGLVDFWTLQKSLNNEIEGREALEHYKGNIPQFYNEGVYLDKSTLSTYSNYMVDSEYSIVIQAKDLEPNPHNTSYLNLLTGIGSEGQYIGGRVLGIGADMDFFAMTGSGDAYSIVTDTYNENLPKDWNTFIITWDGNECKFYINDECMGVSSKSKCPENQKLLLGGWNGGFGYTTGMYRNLMVFNKALDENTAKSFNNLLDSKFKNEPNPSEKYQFPIPNNLKSNYLVSEKDELLATIGGRNFYKTSSGDAICVLVYTPGYLGPFLISTNKDAISYTGGGILDSIYYKGQRFYYTNCGYFMPNSSSYTTDRIVFNERNDSYSNIQALAYDVIEEYYEDYDNFENKQVYLYTNSSQEFIASQTGYYSIKCYGARGGRDNWNGSLIGDYGLGGYAEGIIKLEQGEKLYFYVGNNGADGVKKRDSVTETTYNGGGAGAGSYDNDDGGGAGGGATDVRLIPGEWNDFNSLKSRIMVAGGGSGGATVQSNFNGTSGGAGGGLTGVGSIWKYSNYEVANHTYNATQTTGYKFGIGENGITKGNAGGAGAGGGYYGGYASTDSPAGGAGGGSGFISGLQGCDAISADSTENNIIHTGQNIHYSKKVFLNPILSSGVSKKGKIEVIFIGENNN